VSEQSRALRPPEREKWRIVVACRGSVTEGLGHLYRAQSFAALAQMRHDVLVVARTEPDFASIFDGLSCSVVLAANDDEMAFQTAAFRPDLLVIDMVDVSDLAFDAMREVAPLAASISPVFRMAGQLDLFFTRGAAPEGLTGPRIFAGLDYTILNRRCVPIDDNRFLAAVGQQALPIMISFGGADSDNHSRLALEVLRDVDRPLLLWIMLGDGYLHSHDELVDAIRQTKRHEIILARTNRSMWTVAGNCALAVLSSGLSTIEAIYAGLPVVAMHRLNDPSRLIRTSYDGNCIDGGQFADGSFRRLRTIVEELYDDRNRLLEIRKEQHGLIDGKGAERVLAIMEEYLDGAAV